MNQSVDLPFKHSVFIVLIQILKTKNLLTIEKYFLPGTLSDIKYYANF